MFVILTSKPGQYQTIASADIEPLEAWDYRFYGRLQARFVLGRLLRATRVQVVEDDGSKTVNWVPSKFLESFETKEEAHRELQHLCNFGSLDAKLIPIPLAAVAAV
ncbi:MAG: ferredoxin [Proteobacteria bacterium]|nr:ferredoxin [Pseudomonadota bacterium]